MADFTIPRPFFKDGNDRSNWQYLRTWLAAFKGEVSSRIDGLEEDVATMKAGRLSLKTREGADQGAANNTLVTVSYNSVAEVEDDPNYFETTTPSVTIKKDGIYQIDASVLWTANLSGYRRLFVYRNNAQIAGASAAPTGFAHFMSTTWVGRLAENDEIEVRVHQTSGSSLTILAHPATRRSIRFLSD